MRSPNFSFVFSLNDSGATACGASLSSSSEPSFMKLERVRDLMEAERDSSETGSRAAAECSAECSAPSIVTGADVWSS